MHLLHEKNILWLKKKVKMSDTWKDEHSEKKRCSTELKLINYGPFNVNNRSSHTRFLLSYFF